MYFCLKNRTSLHAKIKNFCTKIFIFRKIQGVNLSDFLLQSHVIIHRWLVIEETFFSKKKVLRKITRKSRRRVLQNCGKLTGNAYLKDASTYVHILLQNFIFSSIILRLIGILPDLLTLQMYIQNYFVMPFPNFGYVYLYASLSYILTIVAFRLLAHSIIAYLPAFIIAFDFIFRFLIIKSGRD